MHKLESIFNLSRKKNRLDINIQGVIGVPEFWQSDNEEEITTTKERLASQIAELSELDNSITEIHLNIDSAGGSVNHALHMYYVLNNHPAEKFTNYTGNSASAATILGAVAPLKNISIPEYMSLLIHEARYGGYSAFTGTASELERDAEALRKTNYALAKIYSNLNGKSIEENLKIMGTDNGEGMLLTAQEAKDFGFVGNITNINQSIAAIDTSNLLSAGWSVNKVNQLNVKNMGFFKKEKIKPELKTFESEGKIFGYRELTQGSGVSAFGSSEAVNGTFEIEGNTITIEEGKIVEAAKIERDLFAEIQALNARLDNFEEAASKPQADDSEDKEALANALDRINALEALLQKVAITPSTPKPPKSEFKQEETAQSFDIHKHLRDKQKAEHEAKMASRKNK